MIRLSSRAGGSKPTLELNGSVIAADSSEKTFERIACSGFRLFDQFFQAALFPGGHELTKVMTAFCPPRPQISVILLGLTAGRRPTQPIESARPGLTQPILLFPTPSTRPPATKRRGTLCAGSCRNPPSRDRRGAAFKIPLPRESMALEKKNFSQDWRPRAAVRVSVSEAARMAPLRNFARPLRSIAKSHAEFTNWKTIILGKMSDFSMALKLHFASAHEESNSTIAVS